MSTQNRKPAALGRGRAGLGDITSGIDDTKKIYSDANKHPALCPKFDKCSANICPLDPDRQLRRYIKGEAVCFLLRELVKPGARLILDRIIPKELLDLVLSAAPEISARHAPIRSSLERSAETPSMIAGADLLNLRLEMNRRQG